MRVRDKSKITFARRLRTQLTPPEARLWLRLRARTDRELIFRRQHPVGPYILDFYCAKARLAVEVDGAIHTLEDNPERDTIRDAWLLKQGIETMRIPASEVMFDPDEVVERIVTYAKEKALK